MIKIFDIAHDQVIDSKVLFGYADYSYAIEHLVPLIKKFNEQRTTLPKKFYERLKRDINHNCIMPPLTLSFLSDETNDENELYWENFVNANISNGFILDGIQRLNTLKSAYDESNFVQEFPHKQKIYLNIIISSSYNKLLYRMITLNNGQKPMSARHQIEILAKLFIDFDEIDIPFTAEKDKSPSNQNSVSFRKDILTKGYYAFASNSIDFDNSKIIQEKMNELLAEDIITSDIETRKYDYGNVIDLVKKLYTESRYLYEWFKNANNFIGFCAGANKSYADLDSLSVIEFEQVIRLLEQAFSSIETSKIKLGASRRKASMSIVSDIAKYVDYSENDLVREVARLI